MNIKQASEQSGVPSQNIRFYEKEGLISPRRNRSNGYRDYTEQDIRVLKLIRMLRMLQMPLPCIKAVLQGESPLERELLGQKQALEQQMQQLTDAIRFCGELAQQHPQVERLDVDACLNRMENPTKPGSFFAGWLEDYRAVAKAEQQKNFSFLANESIHTPAQFTAALLQYAQEHDCELWIEQESMNPEFELDGIAYTAWRSPRRYADYVCCTALEQAGLCPPVEPEKAKCLRWVYYLLPPVLAFSAVSVAAVLLTGAAEAWVMALAAALGVAAGCAWRYFQRDHKINLPENYCSGSACSTVKKTKP